MHKCSKCCHVFNAQKNRIKDIVWHSIFYRSTKAFPLGEDIKSFNLVICPACGNQECSDDIRIFWIVPGKYVNFVLFTVLAVIIIFGFWLVDL